MNQVIMCDINVSSQSTNSNDHIHRCSLEWTQIEALKYVYEGNFIDDWDLQKGFNIHGVYKTPSRF